VFEQAFKNIDDVLRKEAGCREQLWILGARAGRLGGRFVHRKRPNHLSAVLRETREFEGYPSGGVGILIWPNSD
jgi:hypothetical protein